MLSRRVLALRICFSALFCGGEVRADESFLRPGGALHLLGAIDGGALVSVRGGARRDDGVVAGVFALALAEASPRLRVGVGAVFLPWKGLLTLGVPARIEWAPLGDAAARRDAPPESVAFLMHGGARLMFAQPVAVDTPSARQSGGLGRFSAAFGALGELGVSLRSAPRKESEGYRLDISLSGLLGPLVGHRQGADDAPLRGLYGGGSLSFGVMLL